MKYYVREAVNIYVIAGNLLTFCRWGTLCHWQKSSAVSTQSVLTFLFFPEELNWSPPVASTFSPSTFARHSRFLPLRDLHSSHNTQLLTMPRLLLPLLALAAVFRQVAAVDSQVGKNLREETGNEGVTSAVRELSAVWSPMDASNRAQLQPMEKLSGADIMVFSDLDEKLGESAMVSFDVKSDVHCVVSVCGLQRKWYRMGGARERCFDLRVAGKSANADEQGLIRGISAAYLASNPVAHKLYLKFDATNFITGEPCQYDIVSGVKTLRDDPNYSSTSASSGRR